MDMPDAQIMFSLIQDQIRERGIEMIPISAATRQGVDEVVQRAFYEVAQLPPAEETAPAEALRTYGLEEDAPIFTLEKTEEGTFIVRGERIERAAAMTYWDYDQAVLRFQKILEVLGITAALQAAGVEPGDTVFIGEFELEWSD
jgi:GTP-binding protein